ncbi:MAG: hypothetical protein ABSH38_19415 [Verrucomicrobiota bacterium]|jgi:hypothetical protein
MALLLGGPTARAQSALHPEGADSGGQPALQATSQEKDNAPHATASSILHLSLWLSEGSDRWARQRKQLFHTREVDGKFDPADYPVPVSTVSETFKLRLTPVADAEETWTPPQSGTTWPRQGQPLDMSDDVATWSPRPDLAPATEPIQVYETPPQSVVPVSSRGPAKVEFSDASGGIDAAPGAEPVGPQDVMSEESLRPPTPIPQIASPEPDVMILAGLSALVFACRRPRSRKTPQG